MSKTFKRVFTFNSKEPKGHCEAVNRRHENGLYIANKILKKETEGCNVSTSKKIR